MEPHKSDVDVYYLVVVQRVMEESPLEGYPGLLRLERDVMGNQPSEKCGERRNQSGREEFGAIEEEWRWRLCRA